MMLASLLLHALAFSTPASLERRAFGARVTRTGLSTRPHARNIAAPRAPKSAVELRAQLQRIADVHSSFWNVSLSLALYNETVSIAVASGADDYAASTRLTPDSLIPMGSTTKMFSASTILQLAEKGILSLDDPVAPLVDRYLAVELPCADEPAYCADECLPIAHCLKSPDAACKSVTAEQRAKCSYCVRHLHCHCNASSACPAHMSALAWWDFDPRIERVTFRQLIGMTSGVLDYYYDETNWLIKQSLTSPRDIEPLEYLSHMGKAFLFEPGQKGRGAYSTNGFSLAGLALAGLFNLTHWHELDQLDLAWGGRPPADDRTLFATRGTCASHRGVAHQYTSINKARPRFFDIDNLSCLNTWMGGNLAARPLDVARYAHALHTGKLVGPKYLAQA